MSGIVDDEDENKKRRRSVTSRLLKKSTTERKLKKGKTMILSEESVEEQYTGTSCAGVEYETIDVLYRKAYNSVDLYDIFVYFDALIKEQSMIKKAKLKDGLYFYIFNFK